MEEEYGQKLMVQYMKVGGKIIKEVEKGDIYNLMVIFLLDSGRIICQMGMEFFNNQMELDMKEIFKMTKDMVKGFRNLKKVIAIQEVF